MIRETPCCHIQYNRVRKCVNIQLVFIHSLEKGTSMKIKAAFINFLAEKTSEQTDR